MCNKDVCLPAFFILVKNITHRIILGTPFLHMLMPINKIDTKGILATINGKEVKFNFITDPQTQMLNEVKDVLNKEKQLNFS